MKQRHVCIVYNAYQETALHVPSDRGEMEDLLKMIRRIGRVLRKLGYRVTIIPLSTDLFSFQRKLCKLKPDVVFNQYEDVVNGAVYEMHLAALVQMMGFPMTGSPALSLGLCKHKYMSDILLQGAGIPIPDHTVMIERLGDINGRNWKFPMFIQPAYEDAGVGIDRESVVYTKKALRNKVRQVLHTYRQPVLVQHYLPGREFNVSLLGGEKITVLPLSEVDYGELPSTIPSIMSYAAKWIETSIEYNNIDVLCPAEVEPSLASKIRKIALRAFKACGGYGYGRVDIRLDENDEPRVLEVNCNPCLEEGIGLARSAESAGITYPQLLKQIIKAALENNTFEASRTFFR